ncbi:MAG: methyltransferase domain-containing protein [Magnetococcales bacterium]|nr:methyltransferase domain-containing protein [Magnetococcales bacterium]
MTCFDLDGGDRRYLHLGCGSVNIPGFFHVDILPGDHIDQVNRIDRLDFIADNSVKMIYCSHALEHYGRFQVVDVLKEWYRVLQPDGVLRLAVPDFAACVKIYYERGLRDGLSGLIGLVCGGQRNEYDFHRMIFDEPLLTRLLLHEARFREVRRWDWRETTHAHIDDYSQAYLPHQDRENGQLMSLNLEAVK